MLLGWFVRRSVVLGNSFSFEVAWASACAPGLPRRVGLPRARPVRPAAMEPALKELLIGAGLQEHVATFEQDNPVAPTMRTSLRLEKTADPGPGSKGGGS